MPRFPARGQRDSSYPAAWTAFPERRDSYGQAPESQTWNSGSSSTQIRSGWRRRWAAMRYDVKGCAGRERDVRVIASGSLYRGIGDPNYGAGRRSTGGLCFCVCFAWNEQLFDLWVALVGNFVFERKRTFGGRKRILRPPRTIPVAILLVEIFSGNPELDIGQVPNMSFLFQRQRRTHRTFVRTQKEQATRSEPHMCPRPFF
jgi:hypothetical protein